MADVPGADDVLGRNELRLVNICVEGKSGDEGMDGGEGREHDARGYYKNNAYEGKG